MKKIRCAIYTCKSSEEGQAASNRGPGIGVQSETGEIERIPPSRAISR